MSDFHPSNGMSELDTQMRGEDDSDDMEELFSDDDDDYLYRNERWEHSRLDWYQHVQKLVHERAFEREYRMSLRAWNKLTQILAPYLQRDYSKSRSPEPVYIELIMGTGMRWLTGGKGDDQKHIFGLSRAAAYLAIDDFIGAVLAAPELDIKMPSSDDEWNDIRNGFKRRSRHELLHGCVGAIDGYFQKTRAPSKSEVDNVLAYYSGHYESYGLNCQAACDARLRFMFFGVVAPGNMNDCVAYSLTEELVSTIRKLPRGLYVVGDAAYTLTEQLMTPYTGSQRNNPNNDTFNYHLSQLRIRIEMAFGRLVNKFRILKRDLQGTLANNARVVMACARLHNFIISEDVPIDIDDTVSAEEINVDDLEIIPMASAPLGMCYLPTIPNDEFLDTDGVSHTREAIVEVIDRHIIRRPFHNLVRNGQVENTPTDTDNIDAIDREYFHPI